MVDLTRMKTASHPLPVSSAPPHHGDIVARLQNAEIFREYQRAFQTATGLPLVLRAAGSFQPPLRGSKQINPFCALMADTSKACAACLELQQRAEDQAIHGSATLQCFAGLSESVVPIRIGEHVVAYLQTGQVFLRPPTQKRFRAAVEQLVKWNLAVDIAKLEEAYFKTRVLTKSHYDAALQLVSSFAHHLALISNELMISQSTAEPPVVSKARAYIAEHLGEPLSLTQVARAVNMSSFYFCKVFRAGTGVRFTDYLARARVERTKQLLLQPHMRVSEAAFEAGFQSLSQFNRVFRRIAGESPSTHREHLHGTESAPRSSLAFAA